MIICSQLKTLSVISSKFFRKKEKRKKGKKVRVNVFLDVRSVIYGSFERNQTHFSATDTE
jgi:hypothetical protein